MDPGVDFVGEPSRRTDLADRGPGVGLAVPCAAISTTARQDNLYKSHLVIGSLVIINHPTFYSHFLWCDLMLRLD